MPARWQRMGSSAQLSGKKSRQPSGWLLPAASLSARCRLTASWQLTFLPSAPQYCRCTPAEWLPALGKLVSSMTRVVRRRGRRRLGQCFEQQVRRPRTLANEVLQVPVALAQAAGHRFNALALAIQEQPAHLHACPMPPLRAAERRRQPGQKTFEPLLSSRSNSRAWHPPRSSHTLANSTNYLTKYY